MIPKCQIFTPLEYVTKLLDIAEYKEFLYGKKILENSCGNGNILVEIVKRYIADCIEKGFLLDEIKNGLENDIYAFEIDLAHSEECKRRLNEIVNFYNIYEVKWNINNNDYLKNIDNQKFDFIIGNPPYIMYKELDNETRKFLKEKYKVCENGKFDYCYAFIEKSIKDLKTNGKMSYLIPGSIFKNVFGKNLRNFLLPHINEIYDYSEKALFTNVLTSSTILNLEKDSNNDEIIYHNIIMENSKKIQKIKLGEKWIFHNIKFSSSKKKFGDYFKVSNSVATLSNKVFIIDKYEEVDENYIKVEEFLIEKTLLKKAASPKGMSKNKNEYIIFPYYYTNENKIKRYSEVDFVKRFPEAKKYLISRIEELEKRKSDKNSSWFEYGRSQALNHLNQDMLILSSIITGNAKIYDIDKEYIPYSGFYITKKDKYGLEVAKENLMSKEFLNYVKGIGISASGNSKRITVKDIAEFPLFKI
ncbi:Eco57I restriction-modification methylase domain-containing protein [Haliovirga abyssi]|uniref:site-specific DNA-methyltransferase (adenine-specific) n=1 Tax=Haliovirga abyssi TaxID=2996794 RepID=A0AAU9DI81_9FUSO|nr:Eco57I restriction-modification methylase domain-containing protein [Haliovirga abyssi]BDU49482.1 DNA methyltransferase [Haliovirga abyssi]